MNSADVIRENSIVPHQMKFYYENSQLIKLSTFYQKLKFISGKNI